MEVGVTPTRPFMLTFQRCSFTSLFNQEWKKEYRNSKLSPNHRVLSSDKKKILSSCIVKETTRARSIRALTVSVK